MVKINLFVYGSLLSKLSNHSAQLAPFEPHLVGKAHTLAEFHLRDFGVCPGLIHGGETSVTGELYKVSPETLAHLDMFEGPRLYKRKLIDLANGLRAWTYVMPPESAALRPSQAVTSGDWLQRPSWTPTGQRHSY